MEKKKAFSMDSTYNIDDSCLAIVECTTCNKPILQTSLNFHLETCKSKKIINIKPNIIKVKNVVLDLDKHCGAPDETKQNAPCMRGLNCKSHTITLKRAVVGFCDGLR